MSNASKVFFLGLIGLCEFLEVAGSDEGLLALWFGLAVVGWMRQSGGSAIAMSCAMAIPVLAYGWGDE